jgi:hypothetical protein
MPEYGTKKTTLAVYIEIYVDKNPSMLQCLDMNGGNHPCTIVTQKEPSCFTRFAISGCQMKSFYSRVYTNIQPREYLHYLRKTLLRLPAH